MLKKILIIYTFVLVVLAVLPINNSDSLLNNNFILSIRLDYLAHFAIFIPWMGVAWFYTGCNFKRTPLKAFNWILFGLVLAISTEFIQYYLPYRAFNINDLVANILGVMLGSVFFFIQRHVRQA